MRRVDGATSPTDFWPFIRGLRWLNPSLAPAIDRLSRPPGPPAWAPSGGSGVAASPGRQWLGEALATHCLSGHLSMLVKCRQHLLRNYHGVECVRCVWNVVACNLCGDVLLVNVVIQLKSLSTSL